MSERTLSDPPEDAESVAVEPGPAPTLTGYAAGLRTLRRSIRVYDGDQGAMLADLDDLEHRIDSTPDDIDVDPLIDQYEALADQIKHGRRFVAEQRSVDWRAANRKAVIDELGYVEDEEHKLTPEQHFEVGLRCVLSQIVEPADWTIDDLRALHERVPSEVDRIAQLVTDTNATYLSAVERRDFSKRRSHTRPSKA